MDVKINQNTPHLDALEKSLGDAGRKELNAAAASSLWATVRSHLRAYALSHHSTATRLGAQPTGHMEQAAANTTWRAEADEGVVEVEAPGIRRVFGDLDIRPRDKRALTIPIHALAYGKSVPELSAAHKIFKLRKKGGGSSNILATNIDGQLTPLYILVRRAVVPQDRTILPTDDDMQTAASRGVAALIRKLLAQVPKEAAT